MSSNTQRKSLDNREEASDGVLIAWPYSREWGDVPSGLLGLLLIILLLLIVFGAVPWGFGPPVVR